jgi:hypothetical protein
VRSTNKGGHSSTSGSVDTFSLLPQSLDEEDFIGPFAAALTIYIIGRLHLHVAHHRCCVPPVVQKAGGGVIRSIVIARAIRRVSSQG